MMGGAELAGMPMVELLRAQERASIEHVLDKVASGLPQGEPIEAHLTVPGASGRPSTGAGERVVDVIVSGAAEPGAADAGFVAYLIDATQRRALTVQLTQSQKMQAIGQLAGGVAHDFNNLLTAIIGFCDLLLQRHRPGDQSFADVMQIKQNSNRAANLVRQLLAFSRQQRLDPRVLVITDTLAELTHLLRRLIGQAIELRMVHARDLWPVRVDQGQLEQVIINLAVNARDAMTRGGTLTVTTDNITTTESLSRGDAVMPAGDYVRIQVSDTGTGIAPAIIERIFEPFFSTKEIGSGTGLGLSTVYGIVKQTGGFVFVDSVLGEGTTFSIYLPRHVGPIESIDLDESVDVRPDDVTGAGTILLVEDEDPVRLFSARALRGKGYKVLEAKSGDAALDLMGDGRHIDLLITDMMMPVMDGPTLVRHARGRRSDLRIVCMSGYAEDAMRSQLAQHRDVMFLAKPFSLKQLARVVKDAIDDARA
ncbi:MAG: response regulator [Alphaproteobacteria bacterium]|nr:response regulator [Alphaproteobacteria bacterium]